MVSKQRKIDLLIVFCFVAGTVAVFASAWYGSKLAGLPGWALPAVLLILLIYLLRRFLNEAVGANDN